MEWVFVGIAVVALVIVVGGWGILMRAVRKGGDRNQA